MTNIGSAGNNGQASDGGASHDHRHYQKSDSTKDHEHAILHKVVVHFTEFSQFEHWGESKDHRWGNTHFHCRQPFRQVATIAVTEHLAHGKEAEHPRDDP